MESLVQNIIKNFKMMRVGHGTKCGAPLSMGPHLVARLHIHKAGPDWYIACISSRLGKGCGQGKLYHANLHLIAPTRKHWKSLMKVVGNGRFYSLSTKYGTDIFIFYLI